MRAARTIARLRALDLPLADLRLCVAGDAAELHVALKRQRVRLMERLEHDRKSIQELDALLAGEEIEMKYQVTLKEVPDVPALVVRVRVERPEDIGPEVVRAFNRDLWPHVRAQGYTPSGPTLFACRDLEGEGGPADLEMVVPVEGAVQGAGRVEVMTLPGGRFACTTHQGGYAGLGEAYQAVAAWVEQSGLELIAQSREVYLVDYTSTDDDDALCTEVMYQVR